jgi:hypothetical protein
MPQGPAKVNTNGVRKHRRLAGTEAENWFSGADHKDIQNAPEKELILQAP